MRQRRQGDGRDLRPPLHLPHQLPRPGLPAPRAQEPRHLQGRLRKLPHPDRLRSRTTAAARAPATTTTTATATPGAATASSKAARPATPATRAAPATATPSAPPAAAPTTAPSAADTPRPCSPQSDGQCPTGCSPAQDVDCKKPNGQDCSGNAECRDGNCAGGVCCNTACNDGCRSCRISGRVGTCSAPSNSEICGNGPNGGNGEDENCNGQIDEGCCGARGQLCCAQNRCNNNNLTCEGIGNPTVFRCSCGNFSQPCCAPGNSCDPILECFNDGGGLTCICGEPGNKCCPPNGWPVELAPPALMDGVADRPEPDRTSVSALAGC